MTFLFCACCNIYYNFYCVKHKHNPYYTITATLWALFWVFSYHRNTQSCLGKLGPHCCNYYILSCRAAEKDDSQHIIVNNGKSSQNCVYFPIFDCVFASNSYMVDLITFNVNHTDYNNMAYMYFFQSEHRFDVKVVAVRDILTEDSMYLGEADCFVQYHFPAQSNLSCEYLHNNL